MRHTSVVKILPDDSPTPVSPVPSAVSVQEGRTRRAIVRLLLESGSITAAEIGRRLGISAAGVRRHLDALVDGGDAGGKSGRGLAAGRPGRPAKRYRLTPAGRAKLEHAYDDLASAAMRQLREIGGDEAVRAFARRRIDSILEVVEPADSADPGAVEDAAGQVSDALTRAGYATTATRVGAPRAGSRSASITARFPMWPRSSRSCVRPRSKAISDILGTHVQRLASIVNGDCACTTHVPLTKNPAPVNEPTHNEQGAPS